MTLDIHTTRDIHATRKSTRPVRPVAPAGDAAPMREAAPIREHTPLIHAGVVETDAHDELVLDRVSPSLLRVAHGERVMGFVEHVGRVYVALAGERYDRAVEVAQSLDVTRAARALV
ncbi:hypothetical protein ELQ92_12920 [Labedella populi]|uniref:Uncharacterized protein n=1 Tax=Labedella populi TaxID=2498850 RepID=A0A3S4A2Z3_9MICO|nr:hypothetical protein [Labedella populi]RWZ59170.1 hypothetical protein ELQ92_12920 [Labedella populi]